jgi:hypothetical protein
MDVKANALQHLADDVTHLIGFTNVAKTDDGFRHQMQKQKPKN